MPRRRKPDGRDLRAELHSSSGIALLESLRPAYPTTNVRQLDLLVTRLSPKSYDALVSLLPEVVGKFVALKHLAVSDHLFSTPLVSALRSLPLERLYVVGGRDPRWGMLVDDAAALDSMDGFSILNTLGLICLSPRMIMSITRFACLIEKPRELMLDARTWGLRQDLGEVLTALLPHTSMVECVHIDAPALRSTRDLLTCWDKCLRGTLDRPLIEVRITGLEKAMGCLLCSCRVFPSGFGNWGSSLTRLELPQCELGHGDLWFLAQKLPHLSVLAGRFYIDKIQGRVDTKPNDVSMQLVLRMPVMTRLPCDEFEAELPTWGSIVGYVW